MPTWTRFLAADVRQLGRPIPRRGMHPLVEVLLLHVDMAVEMHDADLLRRALRDPAHAGKADRVVAAQHQRQGTAGGDMRHAAADLVEALLEVAGDGEHVPGIAQRHLLAEIDAELEIVGGVEGGDAADALRAEAGAGAVGGAGIERDAEHGGIVLADVAHVLDVGCLEEGVDAGEMRQLAPGEGRDGAVGQALGARQAHVEGPLHLLGPALAGQPLLRLDRAPALAVELVEARMMPAALGRAPAGGGGRGQAAAHALSSRGRL